QQQQQQQQYKNPLFGGAVAPTISGKDSFGGSGVLESTILIGDYAQPNTNGQQYNFNNNNNSAVDPDDKYTKASRQWNLRSISTRLQASSGQAIRNFIQQPLSAAAAVVTGNHHPQDYSGYNQISPYENTPQNVQEIEEEDLLFEKEEIFIMASRDRTGEFNNAIRSLQSRNITRAVNIRDPRKAKEVQSYSEFMMVAKYIGKNIASAYAKLEKLTMLAKKKSLFDDRPQ
ncbi:syntaxin-5-like, partial [Rhagoletis pomonella]